MERYKVSDGVTLRYCSSCKDYLPLKHFSARNKSSDGLAYSCKDCERETARKSYRRRKLNQLKKGNHAE